MVTTAILTTRHRTTAMLMYVRLARSEQRDSERACGDAWRAHEAVTPHFIPSFAKDEDGRSINGH